MKDKFWKSHLKLNPKNHNNNGKKNNILYMDLGDKINKNLDVDEKIVYATMKNKVNQSNLHPKEEKETTQSNLHPKGEKETTNLFHFNIQVKKTKMDHLFEYGSHENLIEKNLDINLGLEVHGPHPYQLGWVNKYVEPNLTKKCKIKFIIMYKLDRYVEVDVITNDVCDVMFGIHHVYMISTIFIRKANQYSLIKA